MKINKYVIFLLVMQLGTQLLWANYAFSRKIINTCKYYQIKIDDSNISYVKLGPDSFDLSLNLKSNRNNFEMVMLIGFFSVGQAIKHQQNIKNGGEKFVPELLQMTEIKVLVPISKNSMTISATADSKTILQLTDGEISSAEFMLKIKDSLKTI